MVYCEHCGAANDIMNQQCLRCGHALPQLESAGDLAVASMRARAAMPSAAASELGAGIELPEWLRRAAASTPEVASAQAQNRNAPPPEFHVAQSNDMQQDPSRRGQPAASATPGQPASPAWVKPQIARPASPQRPPSAPPPSADLTDTASFISESDLPEWIRQIAAADAIKQAEAERTAKLAATAAEEEVKPKVALPGEIAGAGPASNPWLTRKDGAGAAGAWREPVAQTATPATVTAKQEHIEQPEVVQFDPEQVATATTTSSKKKMALPAVKMPEVKLPKLSLPAMPKMANTGDAANPMVRYALIGAIVVLLLLILVMIL